MTRRRLAPLREVTRLVLTRFAGLLATLSIASLLVVGFFAAPTAAQDDACPTDEEMEAVANAIIVGKVVDVRGADGSTVGNEAEDASVIVEVVGIEKGGAQNPLAVYFPGEQVPNLAVDTELNIMLTYGFETARAESSFSCGYTRLSSGDLIDEGFESQGTLGETAGETLTEAVQAAGLAGAAVLAVTCIWRVFREFRPRLT